MSGKAYYALKSYIGNGYGFGIGHDSMYAYAGAWFDAHGGGRGYPNNVYDENDIDPNDTATRYYSVNSWEVSGGHWNMNALMGENNSNTLVGSGYYSASDEEYFGWIVDPLTVPSAIMSSGGSHGPFLKTTIYGNTSLRINANGGYTYEDAMVNPDIKHRTPTNWPYKFSIGQTIPAALTHSNGQVAFDDIWVQYNGCSSDFTSVGLGKLYEPTVDGRSGTNNFYLAGSGNFVMNQIGHLPIENFGTGQVNRASQEEMQLCVNTLMWISQRKQCEVCAADQNDQQMTHFVHRVNNANAKKIITALQNGGSFWYPLNDCYELMEDLDLTALGYNYMNWQPIKNFTGHWNSKYFDVKVPNDMALFENTTGDRGQYSTGDGSGWNLGTNRKDGVVNVFKTDTESTSVRTTGVARVYGKLGDAKLFNDGQIHEGYSVHIRYEDNRELLQPGDDFSCVVNNVDQYCISNLPCIYSGASTIMRARVYDKQGSEVTKYGPIVARVPIHFWNDNETVPLELLTIEATPIENYRYWEGATSKVLEGSGIIYNQPISNDQVTWYYRVVDKITGAAIGNWVKIGGPGTQFMTEDGAVTGVIGFPVFHTGENGDGNFPHSTVDLQLSMLAYTGNAIQFRTDYVVEGNTYSTIDPGVIMEDAEGIVRIEERPMSMTQSPDQRVMTQDQAIFVFESDYWKGIGDPGYSYKVQYREPNEEEWTDLATSATFSGTYTLNTVDGSQVVKYTLDGETVDTIAEGLPSQINNNKWYPASFWRPDGFTDQQCAQKHTTVTLTLKAADFSWNNYDFRLVCSYRYNVKRTKVENTFTANGNEANAGFDTSRYGKLTIDVPSVAASNLYAQALMMQAHNDENDASGDFGQNYWSEITTDDVVNGWNATRGDALNPLISEKNQAVYTTEITFKPGNLTEAGNRLLTPTLIWGYQSDLTVSSSVYTPIITPININGYANSYANGVGLTIDNYKDWKSIIKTRYDINTDNNSEMKKLVDQLETEHAGAPFGKFTAYITIDDIRPKDENANLDDAYTEWVIVTSLHIESATNPMDFGYTHFYFQCKPTLEFIRGYNSDLLKNQASTTTKGINYDYENGGYRADNDYDTGAELYLDYNISIHANERNLVGCGVDKHSIFNYPDLTIEAPNGLRYILTRYRIIDQFPYGNPRYTSRTAANLSPNDYLTINVNQPYLGAMNREITITATNGSKKTVNPYGKTMTELGIYLDSRGYLSESDEDYAPYLKQGYALYSDYLYPKEIWQWFWRNAVQYHCYDMDEFDGTNEQVYFYIDEKNVRAADQAFDANDGTNPYSSWTAPFDATYKIMLWGAGGGRSGIENNIAGYKGGYTEVTAEIKEGTTLYFVAGGGGQDSSGGYGKTQNNQGGAGGYNGGGSGGVSARWPEPLEGPEADHTWSRISSGGGGGATHVTISLRGTGLLTNYSGNTGDLIGVAGGGAGGYGDENSGVGGASGAGGAGFGQGDSVGDYSSWNGGDYRFNDDPFCKQNYPVEITGAGGGGYDGGAASMEVSHNAAVSRADWEKYLNGVANGLTHYFNSEVDYGTGGSIVTTQGRGGTSYTANVGKSFNGGALVVLSASQRAGGGSSGDGRAKIKVVDLDKRLLRRVGKNAMDIGFQDANECSPRRAKVKLSVANKMYDGAPLTVTASVVWDGDTDAGINEQTVLSGVNIVYSNKTSADIRYPTNASTDKNKRPLAATDSYTATATYSGPYEVTFCWENTAPGKTYTTRNLAAVKDMPVSGSGNVVYFDIYPRPLHLYSYNNDRIYNNISTARVENIKIKPADASSGIVNGDPVALNSTLAYGYYCVSYDPSEYATESFAEQYHTGLYSIKTVTRLELINDPHNNYYIASEDFTGTINPRPLYVHSEYHDETKYKWNYDGNSNDIGNGRYLTDTTVYDGKTMTIGEAYEAIIAGKQETIDITRYTKTEQDNYTNTVVDPNNIKVYDSYYNADIGEEGAGNIYIDNITNYDTVGLNAETYVGSYADSNASEELTGYDSNGDNGVIKPDRYNGLTANTIMHAPYTVKYSYSTDNPQVGQKLTVTIAVTNTDAGYGLAAQNNYVAPVDIHNLRIKSRFAGNGPITLVSTDGIRMNQAGTEFYIDTVPVGQTVNIVFDYTVQEGDDLNALVRDIEQSNEMYLINNNYNDYYIADKDFSGGIYRTTLRVQIQSYSTTYGHGFDGALPYADDVYYWNKGSDSWMTMEGLVEDHKTASNDDEKLDLKNKNSNNYESRFVYNIVPSEETDVGSYPVSYIGLNEFNYDLLKNYIVTEDPGSIEVKPRTIMISVDESQKIYGTANPFFNSTFKVLKTDENGQELDANNPDNWIVLGDDATTDYSDMHLIGSDTIASVVKVVSGATRTPLSFTNGVSNLPYLTTATTTSDVIYQTDIPAEECPFCLDEYNKMHSGHEHYHEGEDHPHSHVPVNGYPVSVNENSGYGGTLDVDTVINAEGKTVSNYQLVYEPNVLKVHPRLIRIEALNATKAYGGTEPKLQWAVDGEIIKPTSEMLGIKAVRESGENVRDQGYNIHITYEESTAANYIVETNDATMTITPVPLTIVFGNQERYYGEENPNDYTLNVVGLKHGDTADTALTNNDGATAKVLESAKTMLSDYINLTYNKFTDVGSNYLYGDKSYCEENSVLVPRQNADGGYNYYVANYTPGVLTIKPRPMLLEVIGWQKELGDPDKVQEFKLTDMLSHNSISGTQKLGDGSRITDPSVVVNPDRVPIVFNLVRAEGEEVGAYPVYSTPEDRKIGNLAANDQKQLELDNPNYDFEYRYANDLIVKRQGLLITVDDKTRYYGDRVNRFYDGSTEYTYHVYKVENGEAIEITPEEAGLNTDTLTFSHLDTQTTSSGTYEDCISLAGVQSTIYAEDEITIIPGNLNIIPRPVTVIAEDNTKVYGSADPELKFTLHDGVKGEDGQYYIEYANGPVLTEKSGADVPVQEGDLEGTGVSREPGEDVWTGEHSFGKAYAINSNDISPYSKDGVKNYEITMEEGNFTITPAELVVTVKGGYSKTYGEKNPTFGADITGFQFEDTQETALTGALGFATLCDDMSGAGKYIVTAGNNNEDTVNPDCVVLEDGEEHIGSTFEVVTNSNFEKNYVIRYVNGDITVNPKELVIRIDHKVKTYGTADPAFTFHFEDNGGNIIGLVDPENSPLNVELHRTPGENVIRGDVTASDSLDKWGTTLYDGDYLITASYDMDNPNYKVTVYDGSLKIVPATLTVKVDGGYRTTYGEDIPEFTYSITGFVGRDVEDETGTGIQDDESNVSGVATMYCNDTTGKPVSYLTKVGNYPINFDKQELVSDNSNYKFVYIGGDLTIGKKPIHVKADDQTKVYGDKDPDPLTWTITDPEEIVNPGDEDYFIIETARPGADTDPGEQVGKYPITITGEDPSGNYEIITEPGTLTITPATIVVTVLDDEKYFGEDNPVPQVTITGYKRGDTIDDIGGEQALKTDTTAEKWSPVGEYPVTAENSEFSNPNYEFVYIDGTLTIKPLVINIKAEDDRKVYGENDPSKFVVSYEVVNEKGEPYQASDDLKEYIDRALQLNAVREPGENIRPTLPGYAVVPTYNEVPNIEIGTVTPGHFFIDPREVTITANSAEKIYDGTPLTDSGYTYTPELVNNEKIGIHDVMDSVTVTGSQTEVGSSSNVPSNAVIVNTLDGTGSNSNYIINYVNGELTVHDKETVSIEKSADREYATDNDVIRYTITVTNSTSHDLHQIVVKDTNNFVGTPVLSQANGVTYDAEQGAFIIDELSHLRDAQHTNSITFSYTYTVLPDDHGTDNNDILENNARITDMKVVKDYTEGPDGTLIPNYTDPEEDWLVGTPDVDVEIIRQNLTIEKSADKTGATVGDVVTYTLKVTNTGNCALENVVVSDKNNFMGADVENALLHFGYKVNDDGTWTIPSLGVGKSVTITYKYTVVAEDMANKQLDNIATAVIPPREDPTIPEKPVDSNEVIVPLAYKHLTIVKAADKEQAYPGEVVHYSVVVTNDGSIDMKNVTVSDDTNALGMFIVMSGDNYTYNPETKLFTIPTLNVGDSVTLNYLYIVQNGDPNTIINVATATAPKDPDTDIPGDKDVTEPSNPVEVDVLHDGLTIEKSADKTFIDMSGTDLTVTYTLKVTNTGNTKLTSVVVTDTSNGNGEIQYSGDYEYVDGKWLIPEMNAGASVEITYVYTAVAEDEALEGGNIINTAIAEGKNPNGDPVPSDPDTETVHVGDIPERNIEVVKTSRESGVTVGDTIHYTITVTNKSTVPATNVVVSDYNDGVGEIQAASGDKYIYNESNHSFTIAEIGAGEVITIPVTYTVQEGDKGNTVNNVAVETPETPKIEKSADKQVVRVSEVVTYTLTVTNTTSEAKTNVTVKDNNNFTGVITPAENTDTVSYLGDNTWLISSIDAGASIDIVYTYTVMNEDEPNGMLINDADMTYTTDSGKVTIPSNEVDIPVIPEDTPERVGPSVAKQADKAVANVGDTVHYTVTFHNNDDVDYVNATLTDKNNFSGIITNVQGGTLEAAAPGSASIKVGTIPAGQTVTVEYDYIVLSVDAGKDGNTFNELKNVATLHYWYADEDQTPENEKTKPTNEVTVKVPGSDVPVPVDPPKGELKVEKFVDKSTANVGDILRYTVKVSNVGNGDLENVLVEDFFDGHGKLEYIPAVGVVVNGDGTYTINKLPAGTYMELNFTYVVVDEDVPEVLNAAVVTNPPKEPPLEPEKSADKKVAYVDEIVTYTISVYNPDTKAKTNVIVADTNNFTGDIVATDGEKYQYNGDKTWTIPEIGAGETIDIVYTYKVTSEDANVLENTADVTYTENGNKIELETPPVDVVVPDKGVVTIHKQADKKIAKPGETVTYTVTVTNQKGFDVHDVVVTDANNFAGTISGVDGADYTFENGEFHIAMIPAGGTVELTYTYVVEVGDVPTHILENIATAHVPGTNPEDPEHPGQGIDPNKPIDPDEDIPSNPVDVEVPGSETETNIPDLSITKSVDKDTAKVGETLNYTVTVKNSGKGDAENILIKDFFTGVGTLEFVPMDGVTDNGDDTFTVALVKAGESVDLHFTYVVQEGDAPEVLNAALVKEPTPPADIEKSADKQIAKVDEIVTYTIKVTNNSEETLTNMLVTDTNNFVGAIDAKDGKGYTYNNDGTWTIEALEPGQSINIVYTYTMQSEDESVIKNTADVKYTHNGEEYNIPSDPVDVEKPNDGVVTIRKAADKTMAEPNEVITYTVTIHNGKDYDLTNVRLTDANNFAGQISGVDGAGYTFQNGEFVIDKIPAGGDAVVHYTYTVQIADVPTHILENVATAHIPSKDLNEPDEELPSNKVDVEVPGDGTDVDIPEPESKLTVTKSVDKETAKVGDTLNYSVTVTNSGDADATNVMVKDFFDGIGTLNFIAADGITDNGDHTYTIDTVKAGASVTLNFTYVVQKGDEPEVLNAAVVQEEEPPIDIEKEADKHIAMVDEIVTYTIKVTNTTGETIENLLVSDTNNFVGSINAQSSDKYAYNGNGTWTIDEIGAGETINIVYTYTMQSEDESVIENSANVKYSHNGEEYNIPSNPVDVEKPDDGVVTIRKAADKTMAEPNEVITYTVTIHNGKDHDITNVRLTDANNFAGQISGVDGAGYTFKDGEFVIDKIPAGGDAVVHYTYTVQIADVPTHILENVATAHVPGTNPEDPENPGHGIDPDKPIDPDEDIPSNPVDVEVPGSETETDIPSLSVSKSVDKAKAKVGETLNYSVTVTNGGDVDATNVTVKDYFDGVGTLNFIAAEGITDNGDNTYTISTVKAGESVTLNFTYVVQEGDAPEVLNAAVILEDEPPVDIEKDADKYVAVVDEIVTYTIKVTNTTDETITNLLVSDTNNFAGDITAQNGDKYTYNGDHTWTISEIGAGESIDIVYTYTMQATDANVIENTADVKYSYNGESYDIPSNPVDVEKPEEGVITIRKTADKTMAEPGEVVTYTVTIHNGKSKDVENVRLTDANNFAGTISGVDGSDYTFENGEFLISKIPAGGDVVVHYTYTVQIADVDTQILENVATAHVPGTNPEDPENPGHGIDPDKPIDPDEDIPSNPVDVEVPGSETETDIPQIEVTKSVDKAQANVGDTLNYTVTVTNKGIADAKNVTVEDFFDGHGTLNFTAMDGVQDNGNNTFTIASIKAGESIELHFTYEVVTADAPRVLNAVVATEENPPIDVEKDADKYVATNEEVVTYTITVENTIDETVNNVIVKDHNNFAGEIVAGSTDRYTYNGDGTWTIGYLNAGEKLSIVYTYTVTSTDASVMENTATITYTHDGEKYKIPSNPVDVVKPDDGIVTIWKTADKTEAKPGEVVTYTVTVHNGKANDIVNATVSDTNNFAGDFIAIDGSGYHFEDGHFVIDKIPAGGDVVLHYAYTVQIADVDTQTLKNVATIHVPGTNPEDPEHPGQGIDPDKPIDPDEDIPSNEVDVDVPGDETETEVPLTKSLTIVKSADKSKVYVGETINYRVVITNTGEVDLVNVTVKDTNNGASHINASSGDGYTYDDATSTFTIERIPVGESFTLSYTYVAVDADVGHDVVNVAIAKAPGQNPEDPDNPGQGIDPDKPIDEDVEEPSNEVVVPVVEPEPVPETPTPTPNTPTPTPSPEAPVPSATPTPTPIGWLDILKVDGKPFSLSSIFGGNKQTGIGFVQGIIGLLAVVAVGSVSIVLVNRKRREKKESNKTDKNNKSDAE